MKTYRIYMEESVVAVSVVSGHQLSQCADTAPEDKSSFCKMSNKRKERKQLLTVHRYIIPLCYIYIYIYTAVLKISVVLSTHLHQKKYCVRVKRSNGLALLKNHPLCLIQLCMPC